MGYDMGNRQKNPMSALGVLSLCVLAASALTFSLPKEYFDPHLGVGLDIFCKSLTFMGAEFQDAPLVVVGGPLRMEDVDDVYSRFPHTPPRVSRAIRAPPSIFAHI